MFRIESLPIGPIVSQVRASRLTIRRYRSSGENGGVRELPLFFLLCRHRDVFESMLLQRRFLGVISPEVWLPKIDLAMEGITEARKSL